MRAAGRELEVGHNQDESDDGSTVPEFSTELSSPEVLIETQEKSLSKVYDGMRERFPELSFVMSRASLNSSDNSHVPFKTISQQQFFAHPRMEWCHGFKFPYSIKLMLFMY